MVYLITYDLNAEGQDYNLLYEKIKSLGEWFHPLESVWFLRPLLNILSATDISTTLRDDMDNNDSLFVVEISGKDRQGWMPKTAWKWLNDHK